MKQPDPHFGTDDEMLAWCEREGIVPTKDDNGNWDWDAAWATWLEREGNDQP